MSTDNTNASNVNSSSESILHNPHQSCQVLSDTQHSSIRDKHWLEWTRDSAVSPEITRLAVKSLNERTVIKQHIGWRGYPDCNPLGWFASGLDLKTMQPQAFGQFKPDVAIQLPDEEKPAKYITDKGHPYDAIALPHPDKDFWQQVKDDPSIPVPVTEGTKKSGALMTCGYAALAVTGVDNGLRKGKLVSNFEVVAVPGRPIPIIYDADLLTKKEVRLALQKLATAFKQKDCIVTVAVIPAELDCKGIDDVLVNHGPEIVKKIMADAIPYSTWLKN